ncbi:MAG TPA: hypothetical protein VLZ83_07110 [Edaphocola sp.]|nr:hypothetical protein [Edaphocola sp.]
MISCKKENNLANIITKKNPLELIAQLGDLESDYSIKVSTSLGHSLTGTNSFSKASVFIEAFNNDEENIGELLVENQTIPFIEKSYFLQLDTTQNPLLFTGKQNTYQLNGNNFPNFNITNYSSSLTDITFSGLSNNKLPRNSSLIINWTPDENLPISAESAVYLSAEDENGEIITLCKLVDDSNGNISISSSEMNLFSEVEKIRVYYAKGFSNLHNISGKKIAIGSIGFTYCTIFFQ